MKATQLLKCFTDGRNPSFKENDNTPAYFLSDKQTKWFLDQVQRETGGLTHIISYTGDGKSYCFQKLSGKNARKSAYVTVRDIN